MNSIITKLENFQKFNSFPFHIDVMSSTKPIEHHYHNCTEMLFVKNGTAINLVDSFPFHHSKGHLFLIGGQVPHTLFEFKDFVAYRILFDMSIFDKFDNNLKMSSAFISLFEMSNLGVINNSYRSVISLNTEYTDRLICILDELLCAYQSNDTLSEAYIRTLFYTAVALIIKCYDEKLNTEKYFSTHAHSLLRNTNEHINIAEFAKRLNISRAYLYKLCMKIYGKAPSRLINDIRMRNAKALLALTDKSITEVAAACGFENPVYFAEVFKAHEGVPPSQYRKKTQGNSF